MDWTSIIVTAIGSLSAIATTVITTHFQNKKQRMYNARQDILLLINLDKTAYYDEHRMPRNFERICYEFDDYKANGGNTYVAQIVDEYKSWYGGLTCGDKT